MGEKLNNEAQSARNLIAEKTNGGFDYLKSLTKKQIKVPGYVPSHFKPEVDKKLRYWAQQLDVVNENLETVGKGSPEYNEAVSAKQKINDAVVTLKSQVDAYTDYQMKLRESIGVMSKGTHDANLYTNCIVGGAQSDYIGISDDGRISFAAVIGDENGYERKLYGSPGPNDVSVFHLDDMHKSPIVVEPFETKTLIWQLAEKTYEDKKAGKDLDPEWIYNRVFQGLSDKGHTNTIGVAFADLAGDKVSKSFAEQYEEGLKDSYYYVNPTTGEPLPRSNAWMKDPNNAELLQKFLGRYVTSIMQDIHGTINKNTLALDNTKANVAQNLINKYSK
jgi:hypothetical protein